LVHILEDDKCEPFCSVTSSYKDHRAFTEEDPPAMVVAALVLPVELDCFRKVVDELKMTVRSPDDFFAFPFRPVSMPWWFVLCGIILLLLGGLW